MSHQIRVQSLSQSLHDAQYVTKYFSIFSGVRFCQRSERIFLKRENDISTSQEITGAYLASRCDLGQSLLECRVFLH
ncbi:hypothetical protein C0J52_08119 [Blattella germanica]|nr:hypothetical protein C0J52_08119 [Blattella germanica]